MMTTMAALLGGLPLALGTGVGSELRRPLGIAIVGGLIVSQMLTLYTTPVVYLYLDRACAGSGASAALPARPPAPDAGAEAVIVMIGRACAGCCSPSSCAARAGCAVGPNYVRPAVGRPTAYKEQRRLEDRAARRTRPSAARGGSSSTIPR